ncbi:His-Xaa-Ser system protein HxsD [Azospirillum melinis]
MPASAVTQPSDVPRGAAFPFDFTLSVDMAIFPREVVLRTCYAFTDRCHCWLESEDGARILVGFRLKTSSADADAIRGEFGNALIDFGLRASIEEKTRAVREAIVSAALTEASAPAPVKR